MLDDIDPRTRDDDDPRDVEVVWVRLDDRGRSDDDARDVVDDTRDRDRDARERDPRDPFVDRLDLPRGLDRELVLDGAHRYELNGDESRSLATVGALRVVSEHDLRDPRDDASDPRETLRHLRDEGLVRLVSLDGGERAVTLTDRGQHLLETHRREGGDGPEQAFYADVSRPTRTGYGRGTHAATHAHSEGERRVVTDSDRQGVYRIAE